MRDAFCVGAPGALLMLPGLAMAADAVGRAVTFTKDIAPIFQEKCQDCHRQGHGAPMSLVTYEETRPWAKAIKQRVITRNMPPWHLDKTVGIQHFQNDRSLYGRADRDDRALGGRGRAARAIRRTCRRRSSGRTTKAGNWPSVYGQPDLVLKSEPYTMPAHGQDVWFKPLTEVPITEPRWVRAVEMRPATAAGRKIMHHVLARLFRTSRNPPKPLSRR